MRIDVPCEVPVDSDAIDDLVRVANRGSAQPQTSYPKKTPSLKNHSRVLTVRIVRGGPMPKLGVTMPGLNQPIDAFPTMASAAEDAGFDSVWNYEFHRNPFVVHALTAKATSRITLGTGLAAAAGRSPFEMANAAADVDAVSHGRTALGMSMGAFGWSELLNGVDISHPASRMREYIELLHRVWDWTAGMEVGPYEGRFYRFSEPQFNPFGQRPLARPHIPIYLGALRPTMARLGGQIADGVLGYFMPPQY